MVMVMVILIMMFIIILIMMFIIILIMVFMVFINILMVGMDLVDVCWKEAGRCGRGHPPAGETSSR